MDTEITLKTNDGIIITVPYRQIRHSNLIRGMVEAARPDLAAEHVNTSPPPTPVKLHYPENHVQPPKPADFDQLQNHDQPAHLPDSDLPRDPDQPAKDPSSKDPEQLALSTIPLPNVSFNVMQKVIHYLQYHANDPLPKLDDDLDDDDYDKVKARNRAEIGEWDKEFMNVDDSTIFDLLLAANYLDIKSLLDLGCKIVALELVGKDAEQIRQRYNIKKDFTPEEEKEIEQELAWASER